VRLSGWLSDGNIVCFGVPGIFKVILHLRESSLTYFLSVKVC
jgi:hypothetical protein